MASHRKKNWLNSSPLPATEQLVRRFFAQIRRRGFAPSESVLADQAGGDLNHQEPPKGALTVEALVL